MESLTQYRRLVAVIVGMLGIYCASSSRAAGSGPRPSCRVTTTGNMTVELLGHAATLLLDSRVLITGGVKQAGKDDTVTGSTEFYGGGGFSPGPAMKYPRYSHRAVRLWNGDVLIVGGVSGHKASD